MATIRRVYYTRPIPADAVRVTVKGKPAVRFTGDDGKPVVAPLTADGQRCRLPSAKWYGQYTDAAGTTRRVPLSENKTVAQQMLNELVRRVELEKVGITDPFRESRSKPLADHLAAYRQFHADKGNTGRQTDQVVRRCERVFAGCGFARLADLNEEAALRWLTGRRTGTRAEGGIGPQTFNHYVTAIKAFGNWLVRTNRATESPFRHMGRLNVEVDVRHQRRPLSADEFTRLLVAARTGGVFRRLSGADRAVLYLVAGMTGLRASELASLTPESFALAADPPVVAVEAAYSKHRRRDEVPLHPALVTELRDWLGGKAKGERLWPGNWAKHNEACDLIKRDLEAARSAWIEEAASDGPQRVEREQSDVLVYRDREGRVADFHALRHRFVTELVRAGVEPKDAKELARHSTITLTMDRYSHVTTQDTAAAVARLEMPAKSGFNRESPAAGGTAGGSLARPCPALALPADTEKHPLIEEGCNVASATADATCMLNKGLGTVDRDRAEVRGVHPTGVEPVTLGSEGHSHKPRKHAKRPCFLVF